jgi:hypothetical protein
MHVRAISLDISHYEKASRQKSFCVDGSFHEHPSYFVRKKYVRNDMFSLKRLLDNSVSIPSIKSVYSRDSSD